MLDRADNVLVFLEKHTESLGNKIALGIKSYLGWRELTYKGLSILSRRLAGYLIERGMDKGDKIAILSESKPEWGATLFAAVLSGATLIPLDTKLTEYELNSILNNAEPRVLICSNTYLDKAKALKEKISSIEEIIVIDEGCTDKTIPCIYNLPDLKDRKWRHRNPQQSALIIYTSGTTGNPKGIEISYKNVMSQVKSISKCFPMSSEDRLLSILPMNHLFELTVGFLSFLSMGTAIYYSKSLKPNDLFPIISEKEITFMVVVPAFLKLLKNNIENEIKQSGFFSRMMFNFLYQIAAKIPSVKIRKFLFPSIHKKFGGKFRGCISGGAPLDIEIAKFLETIGIRIYEGYGLSEASPVISLNTNEASKLGSVGKVIPGVEAKIDKETGELLVRGDNIMKGYYNNPELTAEVIDQEGWLHTGDIAEIDKDGFLFITGRIKNMIVLNGGKKVFPEEVEAILSQSQMFQEVCILSTKITGGQKDGTEDVTAVIVPKPEVIEQYPDEKELETAVRAEVKQLSQQLSTFKRPGKIVIMKENLPRTATSKIKRKEIKALLEK